MKFFAILLTTVIMLFAASCSEPQKESANSPPSFLDPTPKPPTSQTTIWAGINLMTEPPIYDYVVVINKNKITKWGKRGSVEVPSDSVGVDMRQYWIKSESGKSLSHEVSGEVNLSNFIVIKGERMGVRPQTEGKKIVARIKNSDLIYFNETGSY